MIMELLFISISFIFRQKINKFFPRQKFRYGLSSAKLRLAISGLGMASHIGIANKPFVIRFFTLKDQNLSLITNWKPPRKSGLTPKTIEIRLSLQSFVS